MKKLLALLLVLVMILVPLVSCSSKNSKDDMDNIGYLNSSFFSSQKSAEEVAEAFIKGQIKDDVEAQINLIPEFYLEYIAEKRYDMEKYDKDELICKVMQKNGIDMPNTDIQFEIFEVKIHDDEEGKQEAKSKLKSDMKYIGSYELYEDVEDEVYVSIEFKAEGKNRAQRILCLKMEGKWYAFALI